MKITSELLEKHGACRSELERFREQFPEGLEPSMAVAGSISSYNLSWAAGAFMTPENLRRFQDGLNEALLSHFTEINELNALNAQQLDRLGSRLQTDTRVSGTTRATERWLEERTMRARLNERAVSISLWTLLQKRAQLFIELLPGDGATGRGGGL